MSRSLLIRLLLLSLTLLIVIVTRSKSQLPPPPVPTASTGAIFPVTHYRLQDIAPGISQYPPVKPELTTRAIVGAVAPHHLLAEAYLAQFFQSLSAYPYRRVILLGPNHNELGSAKIVTSPNAWETPYGEVSSDSLAVSELATCTTNDPAPLLADHSLEVLMPYLRVYLPSARVIPLLISAHATASELETLVACLTPKLTPETLLLVSTDFSHYLHPDLARVKDEETLVILKSWDRDQLLTLTSDHLDSPPSLYTLLSLLEAVGATKLNVYAHTSASDLAQTPNTATTTHLFLTYTYD